MMQQQMMQQWQYAQAVQQQQWQQHQQWQAHQHYQAQQQAQHQQQQEAAAKAAQHAAALQAAQEAQQKLLAQQKHEKQRMDEVKKTVDAVNQRLTEPAVVVPPPPPPLPANIDMAGMAKSGAAAEVVPALMKVQIQTAPPHLAPTVGAKAQVPPIMSKGGPFHTPAVIPPRLPAKSAAGIVIPAIKPGGMAIPPIRPAAAGGVPAPRLIAPIHGPEAPKAPVFYKAAPP